MTARDSKQPLDPSGHESGAANGWTVCGAFRATHDQRVSRAACDLGCSAFKERSDRVVVLVAGDTQGDGLPGGPTFEFATNEHSTVGEATTEAEDDGARNRGRLVRPVAAKPELTSRFSPLRVATISVERRRSWGQSVAASIGLRGSATSSGIGGLPCRGRAIGTPVTRAVTFAVKVAPIEKDTAEEGGVVERVMPVKKRVDLALRIALPGIEPWGEIGDGGTL